MTDEDQAVWRHEKNCLFGVVGELRQLSQTHGPHAVRRRLQAAFPAPFVRAAIIDWFKENRPAKIEHAARTSLQ